MTVKHPMNYSRPPSFWDRNPEMRDVAAWLTSHGWQFQAVKRRLVEKFGSAGSVNQTNLTRLRRGITNGRWNVPMDNPEER